MLYHHHQHHQPMYKDVLPMNSLFIFDKKFSPFVPNLNEFLSSVEHKDILKNCVIKTLDGSH